MIPTTLAPAASAAINLRIMESPLVEDSRTLSNSSFADNAAHLYGVGWWVIGRFGECPRGEITGEQARPTQSCRPAQH